MRWTNEFMEMSFGNCMDCPITLLSVFGQLVAIALMIALGFWLLSARFAALRAAGVFVAVIGFLFALGFTLKVPNWGIINPFADRFAVFSRLTVLMIYGAFDGAVLLAFTLGSVIRARRFRKTPHTPVL